MSDLDEFMEFNRDNDVYHTFINENGASELDNYEAYIDQKMKSKIDGIDNLRITNVKTIEEIDKGVTVTESINDTYGNTSQLIKSDIVHVPDLSLNSTFDNDFEPPEEIFEENCMLSLRWSTCLQVILFGLILLLLIANVYSHIRHHTYRELLINRTHEIYLKPLASECEAIVSGLFSSSTCNPCLGGIKKFVCYPSYFYY